MSVTQATQQLMLELEWMLAGLLNKVPVDGSDEKSEILASMINIFERTKVALKDVTEKTKDTDRKLNCIQTTLGTWFDEELSRT